MVNEGASLLHTEELANVNTTKESVERINKEQNYLKGDTLMWAFECQKKLAPEEKIAIQSVLARRYGQFGDNETSIKYYNLVAEGTDQGNLIGEGWVRDEDGTKIQLNQGEARQWLKGEAIWESYENQKKIEKKEKSEIRQAYEEEKQKKNDKKAEEYKLELKEYEDTVTLLEGYYDETIRGYFTNADNLFKELKKLEAWREGKKENINNAGGKNNE